MTEVGIVPSKPKTVVWAIRLLFLSLILGGLNLYLNWDQVVSVDRAYHNNAELPPFLQGIGFILCIQIFTFAILSWLFLKISAGRNWARIFCLIGNILGIPFFFSGLRLYSYFVVFISVLSYLMDITALYFLFTNPASAWFRALKTFKRNVG